MFVYLDITGTESGPGDRVDAGVSARYLAMRLGGRAEDTETSEIEIEQLCKEAICLKKDSFSSLVDRTTAEEKLLALQRDLDYYVQAELYGI